MPIIRYEIYLDPKKQEETRRNVEKRFNTSLESLVASDVLDSKDCDLRNCYIAKFDINEDDVWDLANDIAQIKGVLDVEPELITGIIEDDVEPKKCAEEPKHEPNWSHKKTFFKEAEQYSKKEGRTVGGEGIRIGQLDTGYTDHPEIDRMLKDEGYDSYGRDPEAQDELLQGLLLQPSHGTATASVIIGSEMSFPGGGRIGVAPLVSLIPIRISPSVIHVFSETILLGVLRALEKKVDVITMSMGGAPSRQSWRIASREAYERGVIWVTAAGNKVGWVVWPARYRENIAVAATDFRDKPWEDTCRGKAVDISAPGHNVYVGYVNKNGDNCYKNGSGTSYATPHVAAAAAVWLAHHGKDLNVYKLPWQRVEAFRYSLKKSARVPNKWNENEFGDGILKVDDLLRVKLPKPEELKKRFTPTPLSQTQAETINMVSKEIYYLTWSAKQRDDLDNLDYVIFKLSKTAKPKVQGALEKEKTKNKSDKEKMDMLRRAFLIGL